MPIESAGGPWRQTAGARRPFTSMTLLIAIGALWLAALVLVAALCRGAKRGDDALAAATEHARRIRASAGIVVIDGPAGFSARDLREQREDAASPAYAGAAR
jgi:hypothetical protein